QATARNVANIMARLLREIIESTRKDSTTSAAPPAPPPASSQSAEATWSTVMTTGTEPPTADDVSVELSSRNRTEVKTSEELQDILITNVDGEQVLTATVRHGSEANAAERKTTISITVTSVPLEIATTPPTEVSIPRITMPTVLRPERTTVYQEPTTTTTTTTTTEPSTTVPATTVSTSSAFPTLIPNENRTTTTRATLFTTRDFNPKVCEDNHSLCNVWSKYGECVKNPGYMYKYCRHSCGICSTRRR
ncbi:hypothetical protein PFISCL1PPCAC_7750, partial [Pristionchus fissidentatus]